MQLTEVSELDETIELLRRKNHSSPSFHDRHDSEVDRMFNSSPVDDHAMSFDPVLTNHHHTSSGPTLAKPSSNKATSNKPTTAKEDPKVSKAKGRVKTIVFELKKENKKMVDTDLEQETPDPLSDVFYFTKDDPTEYTSALNMQESALTSLLKRTSHAGVSTLSHHRGMDSKILQLTIFVPNRDEMNIELYEVSTVDESIQTILRTHRAESRQPELYYGHPECYELRLHDQDGYPDEDFPALDRSRKIANFGDAGNHEYCLCERPDACPPEGTNIISTSTTMSHLSPAPPVTLTTHHSPPSFIKILLPNEDGYAKLALEEHTTGLDLLPTLQKKHRLQLKFQTQEYVLLLSSVDQARLALATNVVSLQTKLQSLAVHELTLGTSKYYRRPEKVRRSY